MSVCKQIKASIIFLAVASLAGCASKIPRPANSTLVPLYEVISQVKCELAQSILEADPKIFLLDKSTISGTLTSKIVTENSGGASVGVPKLIPIGGGAGASGSFGIEAAAAFKTTNTTTTKFIIDTDVSSSDICNIESLQSASSLGIRDWLKSLQLIEAGEPRIGVTELKYALEFGVKYTAGAKATLLIVPVSISANAKAIRDDVQTLTLEFKVTKGDIVLRNFDGNVE